MKVFVLFFTLLMPLSVLAQQPDNDPIARQLFPPEQVMNNSQQLGLTEKQRAAIKGEIQKVQSKFLDAQWDLQEETGKMTSLLQQTPIEEAKVLDEADKIMSYEREIKRAQLTLLIRIKNLLTSEQIAKLEALRKGK